MIALQCHYSWNVSTSSGEFLGVGSLIALMEEALVGSLFIELIGEKEVGRVLSKLLDMNTNRAEVGVPYPPEMSEKLCKLSLGYSKKLLESMMTGTPLSYVEHRACM